uniref:Uncharacterized protein n=1 Tax=Romanomermis culicivorax TaxID=13658 RepID=A0A915IVA9_ROMCU
MRALISWKIISDQIITAGFGYGHAKATVVQVYAPMDSVENRVTTTNYKMFLTTFPTMISRSSLVISMPKWAVTNWDTNW